MSIVNAYNVRPSELKPGDEMLFTVKLVVTREGRYRVYRCKWETHPEFPGDVPQGDRVSSKYEQAIAEGLFPVVLYTELKPDL